MEPGDLIETIKSLKREKKIHDAQNTLFETFIEMVKSSGKDWALNNTMQNAINIAAQFSGAQETSLLLLDDQGNVTDSILTNDDIPNDKRINRIETILKNGLAGWVLENQSVGLVSDTEIDERWLTLPNQEYKARSALVVPVMRNARRLGLITLMHSKPNRFDQVIVDFIQQMANQMALVIENAKLYEALEKSNDSLMIAKKSAETYAKALADELNRGKKIQKDFLPETLPEIDACDIATYFRAALHLSGDFFDLFELPQDHLGFVIGDVSGKGVGSALFMSLTRSLLRISSGAFSLPQDLGAYSGFQGGFRPEKALNAVSFVNEYIAREHGDDCMFVTLFFGIIDVVSGQLFYINGGHEPVLIVGENGISDTLWPTGPVIGPLKDERYESQAVQLQPGEALLCYTDGVTEARSENREFFTRNRLEKTVGKGFEGSAQDLLNVVNAELFSFLGNATQSDDITMLAIKWN